MKRLILIVVGIAFVLNTPVAAQQASQNIPVLPVIPESSGDADWYLQGDGYLQRQVEPTIAVSTRNPDHILSFFVDYRAVDVPDDIGLGEETQNFALAMNTTNMMLAGLIPLPEVPYIEAPPTAASEAWVGGSASHDGGLTWSGFFMPGAEFDGTQFSLDSPVYGLQAATDPVAVAGPCGYVYVAFMAFTRGDQSKLVVARFQDLNDTESGKTWQYQGAWELASGNNALNGYFLDKPHINLDVFREESDFSAYSQFYPPEEYECGHRISTSYTTFNGLDNDGKFQSKINFDVSVDRGETWDKSRIQQPYTQNQGSFIAIDPRPGTPTGTGGGTVYLVWRHFSSPDAIVMIKTTNYGKKWSKPVELTGDIPMQTFDQPTLSAYDGPSPPSAEYLTARSNAFPTAAVAAPSGNVFVAWQEKVNVDWVDNETILADPNGIVGRPAANGSPRIVIVRSTTGGDTWTDVYDNPGARAAVDFADRDVDPLTTPPPGFGALPDPRDSGPQVKPWLSFGGGKLALAYTEARGFLGGGLIGITNADLSNNGFISGIDRVVDFRVALLDPSTGQLQLNGSTQVSRYPISGYASLEDGEQVSDIAPVAPFLCADFGLAEHCQPSLNFYNKNHSGAGGVPFMGDYPGMSPILPFVKDGTSWRWANGPFDVPYQGFHVVFPDNRHLIPPTVSESTQPGEIDPLAEWQRYPYYNFPPTDLYPECVNPGSRNTDVMTAKVNASLVLSAPTTYIQGDPGDLDLGYPISIFNQSDETRFYQLEIIQGAGVASFIVESDEPLDEGVLDDLGVVEIFPFSSTSQMVFVQSGSIQQIRIEVTQVQCDTNGENCTPLGGGEQGFVTLNPDPSNPDVVGSEAQNLVIESLGVEEYSADDVNVEALNPFVKNPFVKNPFVKNPFVKNTAIDDQPDALTIIDTTWSVQATEDSGAGSYLPVINIDNADDFVGSYAFQLLIYKNASYGALDGCETVNAGNPVLLSNVSQAPGDTAENPFVKNPFVKNPFVKNPFVKNPFVKNSAITVAPSDGVVQTQEKSLQVGAKNLILEDGTLRVPRLPEKIFITLRAFQLKRFCAEGESPGPQCISYPFVPNIDEPAFSAVPFRCTTEDCIQYLAPDLVPEGVGLNSLEPDVIQNGVAAGDLLRFPVDGWFLKNQGTTDATPDNRPLRHGYYLTASDQLTVEFDPNGNPTNATLLWTQVTGGPGYTLATGQSVFQDEQLFEIPSDITEDTYNLILYVDDLEEVSEYNEENNKLLAKVTIKITAPNVAPVADNATFTDVIEDTPYSGVLTGSDENPTDVVTFEIASQPANGLVVIDNAYTGAFNYTPDADFFGTDTFTFTVSDDEFTSDPATVTLEVAGTDDPPTVTIDPAAFTLQEDGSATGDISVSDADGDTVFIYSVTTPPAHGEVVFLPSDTNPTQVKYTPFENFNGNDSFTITVFDPTTQTSVTVAISIGAVNDAPVAFPQSIETNEDTAIAVTLVAVDVENDPLTYAVTIGPSYGVLSGTAPDLVYTPAENYFGGDSFSFTANDGEFDSAVGTVTINVIEVNDPPVAVPDAVTVDQNGGPTPLLALLLNDIDIEGDPFAVLSVTQPLHGVTAIVDGVVTYAPERNYVGDDSFGYTITDGALAVSSALVSVTVIDVVPDWGIVGLLSPWKSNYSMTLGSVLPMKWFYTEGDVYVDSSMANPRIDVYRLENCNGGPELFLAYSEDYGSGSDDWQGVSDWHYNLDTDRPAFDQGCYNIWVTSQYTSQSDGPFRLRLK